MNPKENFTTMKNTYKIGLLIPSTSNTRNWKNLKQCSFYNVFLKSFLNTYNKEHQYIIYLLLDDDDKFYSRPDIRERIKRFVNVMENLSIQYISTRGIPKGHVTLMWNKAFKIAFDNNCDYFLQCGDDIEFLNKNWMNKSIKTLIKHNNFGLTGPMDYDRLRTGKNSWPGGPRFIQTQNIVSRKHMKLFNFFFPPQIKNWYCDDWITKIYYETQHFYIIKKYIRNIGGAPRYNVIGSLQPNDPIKVLCDRLVDVHKKTITDYEHILTQELL